MFSSRVGAGSLFGQTGCLLIAALAAAPVMATDDHVVLCEAVVTPTANEFIEISNPTGAAVDLTHYYLSDDEDYALLPGAFGAGPAPSIASSDFIAQFPPGASIPAGGVVVVAFDGVGFQTAFGFAAHFEIHGTDPGTPDMIPSNVGTTAGLTNSGESAVLFSWDGTSDLVTDVDMSNIGTPSATNDIGGKTGVSVDGPDVDSVASTYHPDALTMPQQAGDPGVGASTKRVAAEAGHEVTGGGNGITNDDETTEQITATWDGPLFTAPDPGACGGGPPPAASAATLLLTEIVVTPTAGEFIEVHNPTGAAVALSDYYLTDATFAGGSTFYYNIVTGTNAGGGSFGDFHARFPASATIGPGEFQTISLAGSDDFENTYGASPTYELFEDGVAPDAIPDMVEALPGSIAGQGGLSNSGEVVILYFWDGQSDLVTDVDYAVWGDKVEAVDKTGVSIDGPDADATTSMYLADTAIAAQDVVSAGAHASGDSFQRDDLTEGAETQTGGNGVGGNDETSENLSVTWNIAAASPGGGLIGDFVINEIHADPASGTAGDANGDGTQNFSNDEFVEIVNRSGSDQDISGWSLSDGFGVRHTFPAASVVTNDCSVVVFGGGTPVGAFGGSLVQTASSGALGLNNGGDSVTLNDGVGDVAGVSYGSEGGDNQSLTRDPDVTGSFVKHTTATGSGSALFSPGALVNGTAFGGCPAVPTGPFEIYEIQGSGLASPLVGLPVTSEDNVVTAVGPQGFFMQTPDARSDGDAQTSDGIFVFTSSAPSVAVGDLVDVTAVVQEFFNLTELGATPVVTVDSSGNALPAAVLLDQTTPSPIPLLIPDLERFEGMQVRFENGVASAPTDRFGDVAVVAGSQRTFREPGIEFPGLPGLPVWDGNPELFEIDPDGLGLPDLAIDAGTPVLAVEGPLTFSFGDYQILPTALSLGVAPPLPGAVRARADGEFSVGSLNLFRLFDDVDDPGSQDDGQVADSATYALRLEKFSLYIRNVLGAPDVLAIQEVESLAALEDLAGRIVLDDAALVYTSHLVEGNDVGGIDVGFLVRNTVQVDAVTQLGAGETLTFDGSLLHDRPPLLLEGAFLTGREPFPVAVMAVHNRSLGGIEDPADGPRVRQKRLEQAQSIAQKIQDLQDTDPDVHLVVTGDFNAFQFSDGYVDAVAQIRGDFVAADNLLSGPDLVDPNLTNQVLNLPFEAQYSFVFGGNAQVLDHALTTTALDPFVTGFEYGRANADAADSRSGDATELRASDHDGLALFVLADSDLDGIINADDHCPATMIPEGVPTLTLGVNRWALVDGDGVFDTTPPPGNGKGPKASFALEDTGGCSCEQIITNLGLGSGHEMHGCSTGVMRNWVDRVSP